MGLKTTLLIALLVCSFFLKSQTTPWQLTSTLPLYILNPPFPGSDYASDMAAVGNTLIVASAGYVYASPDYGQTWDSIFPLPVSALLAHGTNLFAGASGSIYWSNSAGTTWTNITPALYTAGTGIAVKSFLVNGPYLYVAVSGAANVYRCPLAGLSSGNWTAFNNGFNSSPAISSLAFNGSNLFASSSSDGIWTFSSANSSWALSSANIAASSCVKSIASNNSTLFAGVTGILVTPQIFRSLNGGPWAPSGNSTLCINSSIQRVITHGSDVYAATNLDGVIFSGDNGTTWNTYNDGFKDAAGNWYCSGGMHLNSIVIVGDVLFASSSCGIWKAPACNNHPSHLTANPVICSGNSLSLTATGPGTTHWYDSPFGQSIATGTVYTTPVLTGTASFYVDNEFCNIRLPLTVTVNPTPTLTIHASPDIICAGSSATLTALGASYYSWSNAESDSVIVVTPQDTTTYSVTGTTTLNCSAVQSTQISVAICTGINAYTATDHAIRCFPNPATGKFTISGLQKGNAVEVFDISGRLMYSTTAKDESLFMDFENKERGVYLYRVSASQKETKQGKIILE